MINPRNLASRVRFLSTPSARRATIFTLSRTSTPSIFLSTPSARRATAGQHVRAVGRIISIHALREEGDLNAPSAAVPVFSFLSTPSARRATRESVRKND